MGSKIQATSLRRETSSMDWDAAGEGQETKPIDVAPPEEMGNTLLCRLAPGASLASPPEGCGLELIVLEGTLDLGTRRLEAGGYARRPDGCSDGASSEAGCTLFLKLKRFAEEDREVVHLQADRMPWLQGQGNLQVKPLHSFEGENSALVRWPSGERFVMHQHWGGEEIFVLSGTFEDEHGRYPKGTWLQSPHLSSHHPFVNEETIIFVKTGHLPQER